MILPRTLSLLLTYPLFLLIVDQRSTAALLFGTALMSISAQHQLRRLLRRVRRGAAQARARRHFRHRLRHLDLRVRGSTQPLVAWLIHVTGDPMAPSWYLLIATAVSLAAMFAMAESRAGARRGAGRMSEHDAKPHALSQSLGLERVVDHGESGRAVIHYRARMDMCHSGGIVQGGFVTGWIDAAMPMS